MKAKMNRIAALASGNGSTVESFIRSSQENKLINIEVGVVICNKPRGKAGVYERIDALNEQYGLGIPTINISGKTHPNGKKGKGLTDEESQAILDEVIRNKCDLVVMMGYMKVVRGALLSEFGWNKGYDSVYQAKLLNTHPGPLPETAGYYGVPASKRVLDLKLKQSKHSVHLVAEGVDEGPVIAENPVPVLGTDNPESLFARVQAIEKACLPYVIDTYIKNQKNI